MALPVIAACGDPIRANRDWRAVTAAATVSSVLTGPGLTIRDERQMLAGAISTKDSFDSLVEESYLSIECDKATSTPAGLGPNDSLWQCSLWFDTGDHVYMAEGRSADGVFGTFHSLDRAASTGTITVSPIKEISPPAMPFAKAGTVAAGGKFYLVRVSARR